MGVRPRVFLAKYPWIPYIFLAAAGIFLYLNTLENQLFWDDEDSILNNAYVHDLQFVPNFFTENLIAGSGLGSNYWRPVLLLVFSAEWHLWRENPIGYHLVNMLFHAANGILVFVFLSRLLKRKSLPFIVALVFLVHPLQTEAVTYVSGLGDPLSACFLLLSLIVYLQWRTKPRFTSLPFFLSAIFFSLALMSKEITIVLPGLLLAVEFFFPQEMRARQQIAASAKRIAPFAVLAAAYILLRATLLNFGGTFNLYQEQNAFTSSILLRVFTFFESLATYVRLLLVPTHLHMERSMEPAVSFVSIPVLLGALLFIGLLWAALVAWRRKEYVIPFGIAWFFIALLPMSNIFIPVNGLLYEHWMYVPMVGFFLAVARGGELLAGRRKELSSIALAFFALSLVFFSFQTVERNREWSDSVTFYTQTLAYAPASYRVINNLAMAHEERGDYFNAERFYRKALTLDPKNPVAMHNLGNLYRDAGDPAMARQWYLAAIGNDTEFIFSYLPLVGVDIQLGNYAEAERILQEYLALSSVQGNALQTLLRQIQQAEKERATEPPRSQSSQ